MTIHLSEHTLQIFAIVAGVYCILTHAIRAAHDVMIRRIALQKFKHTDKKESS